MKNRSRSRMKKCCFELFSLHNFNVKIFTFYIVKRLLYPSRGFFSLFNFLFPNNRRSKKEIYLCRRLQPKIMKKVFFFFFSPLALLALVVIYRNKLKRFVDGNQNKLRRNSKGWRAVDSTKV